jgi:hypothetical protein
MGLVRDMANLEHGIQHGVSFDPINDELLVMGQQDCTPILEHNKRLANNGEDGYSPSRELRRVASIPNILVEKWLKEEGINVFDRNDWPRVAAKLDSSEFAFLRTAPGRVSKRPLRQAVTHGRV